MKRLLIQGCTGSIGRSVLSVVREHRGRFRIVGLAAHSNWQQAFADAQEWEVESVAISDSTAAAEAIAAKQAGIEKLFSGPDALAEQTARTDFDLLVNAVTGGAGLESTAGALQRGIDVALANKETMVAAGPIMKDIAVRTGAKIIPIDSEHSAIFQCLRGERMSEVRRLWLTTSGGPFWGRKPADLANITVDEALAHPTWKMGPKITVDSATLFNKGLEVIEAQRLFGVEPNRIAVVAHRQSVIHSLVEFADGSIKAQLSMPDMRLPILFALSYPERFASSLVQTDIPHLPSLTFEPVSSLDHPCLAVCYDALQRGGTAPAALSAADEVAVDAFLKRRIRFTDIARVLERVLNAWAEESLTDIAGVREADCRARALAMNAVEQLK
jgi:1-deoxy-D-xylulose-5-phosphate reductoisomerase